VTGEIINPSLLDPMAPLKIFATPALIFDK
jgi:hypothetical protein